MACMLYYAQYKNLKAMKTVTFKGTRNIVLCGAFAFSLGIGTSLQTYAQYSNDRRYYSNEHQESDKPGKKRGNFHARHDRAPEWHYTNLPRRGAVIASAPSACISLNFRGLSLFFSNGVYYRPHANGYRVVAAPIGIRINALPRGYVQFYVGNEPFFYYGGTYYRNTGGYYEVVRPPVGALVESIPNGYETLNIEGETYYMVDGVQYKPELNNGEIWYRVLKVN
jgi:hypothetical protein